MIRVPRQATLRQATLRQATLRQATPRQATPHQATPHRGRAALAAGGMLAALVPLLAAVASPSVGAAPANPPRNSAPSQATLYACLTPRASIPRCDAHALSDIDAARRGEGIAPMSLPNDFYALTVPERLLALLDIERVDRGLPPAVGLTRRLDAAAQLGAAAGGDPTGPSGYSWGSNWASGTRSTVFDDFSWMYDDGYGSQNLACRSPSDGGCWGHRENILTSFGAPLAMGAGARANSLTELLVADYRPAEGVDPTLAPSWEQIARTLPIGVSSRAIRLSRGARTARLRIWASGESMDVIASVDSNAGWTVSPAGCQLAAGSSCTLDIAASQRHGRTALVLSGANGRQTIPLS